MCACLVVCTMVFTPSLVCVVCVCAGQWYEVHLKPCVQDVLKEPLYTEPLYKVNESIILLCNCAKSHTYTVCPESRFLGASHEE